MMYTKIVYFEFWSQNTWIAQTNSMRFKKYRLLNSFAKFLMYKINIPVFLVVHHFPFSISVFKKQCDWAITF